MKARQIFLSFLCVLIPACTPGNSNPQKLSTNRSPIPGTKTVTVDIPKAKYLKTLDESGSSNSARLVEIFEREKRPDTPPQYRLFGVQKGSIYELLGLQNADIIIAADDYVIPSPAHFFSYLGLLRNQPGAQIEVRRYSQPIVFKYNFTQ